MDKETGFGAVDGRWRLFPAAGCVEAWACHVHLEGSAQAKRERQPNLKWGSHQRAMRREA
jgi:hypothetical protein